MSRDITWVELRGLEPLTFSLRIAAYHDLWQVERSFRMAKTDLRARPIFHRQRDSIEAHLTIVFAALAISRYLQEHTGVSIKKLVNTLRTVRSATINVNGELAHPRSAQYHRQPANSSSRWDTKVTKASGTTQV